MKSLPPEVVAALVALAGDLPEHVEDDDVLDRFVDAAVGAERERALSRRDES